MIEVTLRCDDVIEEYDEFVLPEKAENYFFSLCRKRTRIPSIVVATVDGDVRMLYHVDDAYASNRWEISTDLLTGLPVKRRYIPSAQELSGRKGSLKAGVRLPVVTVPVSVSVKLKELAQERRMPVHALMQEAIKKYLNEDDTILSKILGDSDA